MPIALVDPAGQYDPTPHVHGPPHVESPYVLGTAPQYPAPQSTLAETAEPAGQ